MVTHDERRKVVAARMQAVFEVKWDAGVSAGDAFERARAALLDALQADIAIAHCLTFQKFATGYLHPSVAAETVKEAA